MLNADPIAIPDPAYFTSLNTPLTISSFSQGLLNNDFDAETPNTSLTASVVTQPANGSLTLNADGTFTYTPNAGFKGLDLFKYRVSDGSANSRAALVQIGVETPFSGQVNGDPTVTDNTWQTGGLTLLQELSDGMQLVFRTDKQGSTVVQVDATWTGELSDPDSITAELTFGGITQTSVQYNVSSLVPGTTYRFAKQVTGFATGMYDWSMTLTLDYNGTPVTQVFTGSQAVVDRGDSEFGPGWYLDGLDRLVVQSNLPNQPDGALLVEGDGSTFWFQQNGSSWNRAAGDMTFAQLTQDGSGNYTLQDKWGNQRRFDSNGRLTAVKRVNNSVDSYTFTYDTNGLLTKITDEFNRDFTLEYNTSGMITKATSFSGDRFTTFNYAASPSGPEWDSIETNDVYAQIPGLEWIAPTWNYTWATTGGGVRCTGRTDPVGNTQTYSFDTFGFLDTITRADGNTWQLSPVWAQGLSNDTTGVAMHDVASDDARYTDERGNDFGFDTDRFGNLTRFKFAAGGVRIWDFSDYGILYRVTDPDPDGTGPLSSPVTEFGTNFLGDRLTTVFPDDSTMTATFDTARHVPLSVTDPLGNTATFTIDNLGNVLSSTDPVGNTWTYTWDVHGNLLTQSSPDPDGSGPLVPLTTQFTYETTIYDRVNKITNPDGTFRTFGYDAEDRLTSITDELGRITSYSWNPMDDLIQVNLPSDGIGGAAPVWKYDYHVVENNVSVYKNRLEKITDPLGRETDYEYNERNWVTQITYPDPVTGVSGPNSPIATYSYYATGQVFSMTDPTFNGASVVYTLDANNRVTQIAGPAPGQTRTISYDRMGRVTQTVDPVDPTDPAGTIGRTVNWTYDVMSRITQVEEVARGVSNQATRSYAYQYDLNGRLTQETDPLGQLTNFTYASNGWLSSITLPDTGDDPVPGNTTRPVVNYGYDALGRQTSVTDPLGRSTLYVFDAMSRLSQIQQPNPSGSGNGVVTAYAYDNAGRLTSVTDPLGLVTQFEWDNLDRLTKRTLADPDGPGNPLTSPVFTYSYDLVGNLIQSVDSMNRTTDYAYDKLDRMTQLTEPNPGSGRPVWQWSYNAQMLLDKVIDPLAGETNYTYDSVGRAISMTRPGGQVTNYAYNNRDQITSVAEVKSANTSAVTSYAYDGFDRMVSITDPVGGVTTQSWDVLDQLIGVTDPTGNTTRWSYDGLGRAMLETNALANTRSFQYDLAGNLTRTADRNGRVRTFSFDNLDRMTAEKWFDPTGTDPTVSVTTVTEGGSGQDEVQQVTVNDATNGTFQLGFNGETTIPVYVAGSAAALEVALEKLESIDNVSVTKSGNTWTVTFIGDQSGQNVESLFGHVAPGNDGTNVRTLDFGYDLDSRLISASDPAASYQYTLDQLGRVTAETQTIAGLTPSVVLNRTYNPMGNMTALRATIGGTDDYLTNLTYDNLDRVVSIRQQDQTGGNAVTDKLVNFTYNALGQFTYINRYQALSTSNQPALRTVFTYDSGHRVETISHRSIPAGGGTSTLENKYTYSYNALDQITQIVNLTDGTLNFQYDLAGQIEIDGYLPLPPQPDPQYHYDYDANGNRSGTNYTTGPDNQTTADAAYTYQYDAEGNRNRRTSKANGSYELYSYDHRNRLVQVAFYDSSDNLLKQIDYSYDIFNRLVRRTIDPDGAGPQSATDQFFAGFDGINPTLEFDGPNGSDVSHRYLWGPAVDQLLADEQVASTGSGGDVLWPLADHLGTIRDIGDLDESANSFGIANHRVYDSFGNLISQTNSSASIEFGYTGKYFDPDTGLSYHWNRWFDPALGKWLTPDPLGLSAGDPNLYRYVGNHPTGAIDPTGLVEETGGGGTAGIDPDQGVAMIGMAVPESSRNTSRRSVFSPRHRGYTITRTIEESFGTRTTRDVHNGFLGTSSEIVVGLGNEAIATTNLLLYGGYHTWGMGVEGSYIPSIENPMQPPIDPNGAFAQGQQVGQYTVAAMNAVSAVWGVGSFALSARSALTKVDDAVTLVDEVVEAGDVISDTARVPKGTGLVDDAAGAARPRTVLEVLEARKFQIIESSPIQIPGNAAIRFRTSASGAIEARYTWTNTSGRKFVARLHDPSPGAPSGSSPSWVIERITPGNSAGTRRVTEIFLGDDVWIKQGTWYRYIDAYRNGTATEGMLNILRRGHFPVE